MDEKHDGIETVELEGYTVVRREMFKCNDIWISFNPGRKERNIFIPKKCLNHIGNPSYVQMLVNPEEKKIVLRPLWKRESRRRAPRTGATLITGTEGSVIQQCGSLFRKLAALAGWDENSEVKHRVYGRTVETDGGSPILVFSLDETVFFIPEKTAPDSPVAKEEK